MLGELVVFIVITLETVILVLGSFSVICDDIYIIYDAPRSKRRGSARREKCPKTNLESQGVLCEAYTLIGFCIVYCAQMAHIQGVTVPLHSKTGL